MINDGINNGIKNGIKNGTRAAWLRLGTLDAHALVEARLELHWAAQLPAALGIARATPQPDFGQHALVWNAEHHALASALVAGRRPYRAALRPATPTLLLLNEKNALVDSLALSGHTLDEGLAWIAEAAERYSGEGGAPLALPEHELPAHPLQRGARLGAASPAAFLELARWYEDFARLLEPLRAGRKASPLRVWSHHFDLDTVIDLGGERTLGLGLSPGDDSYAEPYLYVLPTPYPDEAALASLEAPAEWVTDGWIGAVLRGSHFAARTNEEQLELAQEFYRAGEAALRQALGA